MSISPISATSLYQDQLNYFLKAAQADYSSVSYLLAKFGVKSTGDVTKDLAKLKEIQVKTAAEGLKGLYEDDETSESKTQSASYIWYSIMYQLGLEPTGNPEQDFTDLMEYLVDKVQNAPDESTYNQYMSLISLVEDLFIMSGVNISELSADSVSPYSSSELLANYNKADIETS